MAGCVLGLEAGGLLREYERLDGKDTAAAVEAQHC